jgi:chitin synthase
MVCAIWFSTNIRGSTRVAQGEGGKTVIISDEGRFDPRSIPKRKWDEYQADMVDRNDVARSETSSNTGRQSMRTSMFVPTVDQRGRFSRVVDQQNFYDNPPRLANEKSPGKSPLARESYLGDSYVALPPRLGGEVLEMQEAPIHPSQRASRALSSIGGQERTASFVGNIPGLPSDEQLLAEIRKMLASVDLMSVTKKDVKIHLERVFGVPLDVRKEYINQCTEAILSGRL